MSESGFIALEEIHCIDPVVRYSNDPRYEALIECMGCGWMTPWLHLSRFRVMLFRDHWTNDCPTPLQDKQRGRHYRTITKRQWEEGTIRPRGQQALVLHTSDAEISINGMRIAGAVIDEIVIDSEKARVEWKKLEKTLQGWIVSNASFSTTEAVIEETK